ncbi:MAG: hypothetical protein JRF02_06305 [Deltaproteobacteria bacterium]|jgi:c(7)-type cytochrome triheme protein|nr:hypothetical protein [Deltaproteobacteria bacterium]
MRVKEMFRNFVPASILGLAVFFSGVSSAYALEYADIVLESTRDSMEKAGVKAVVFPHWFHRIRFKCKVCHENIFIMKKGANNISMRRIMEGEACGVCHNGQIAWEALYCERCHTADFQPMASTAGAK